MRSRLLATLLGTAFLLGCQESGPVGPDTESVETSSLLQATTFTLIRIVPVSSNIDPPCVSERIFFSGDAHVLVHRTFNVNNGVVFVHSDFRGVTGVGAVTGIVYRFNRTTLEMENSGPGANETETVSRILIGSGSDQNTIIHLTIHRTVTPNGDLASAVFNVVIECP